MEPGNYKSYFNTKIPNFGNQLHQAFEALKKAIPNFTSEKIVQIIREKALFQKETNEEMKSQNIPEAREVTYQAQFEQEWNDLLVVVASKINHIFKTLIQELNQNENESQIKQVFERSFKEARALLENLNEKVDLTDIQSTYIELQQHPRTVTLHFDNVLTVQKDEKIITEKLNLPSADVEMDTSKDFDMAFKLQSESFKPFTPKISKFRAFLNWFQSGFKSIVNFFLRLFK